MKIKKNFNIIGVIGIFIICILSFIIPQNPYMIIPAMSINGIDKPLWFCLIIICCFIYLLILYYLYEMFENNDILK